MTKVQQVTNKIRKAAHHVGVFEHSFPQITADAGEYARAHLIVFRDGLPGIKRLIRYAHSTVNAIARANGVAEGGTAGLKKAADLLIEIRRSTEEAANEIFTIFDQVDPLLEKVSEDEAVGEEARKTLHEARDQLQQIFGALQFQDIASQQIEAVNSLLASLSTDLVALADNVVEDDTSIEVQEGTYDAHSTYRAGASQQTDDLWEQVEQEVTANGKTGDEDE